MPYRLPTLIHNIATSDTPLEVLNALNEHAGLRLHSVYMHSVQSGGAHTREILYHDSVSMAFRQQHAAALREYGVSRVSHLARTSKLPLTTTEMRQLIRPVGRDRWLFDLMRDHRIRDAFLVHHANGTVGYWSDRILDGNKLRDEVRMTLEAGASVAIHRLNQLMMPRKKVRSVELAPSELAVLEHLSRGLRVGAIAKHMEISERTVRDYLRRAQKKLNAVTPTEAAVIAVRRRLI
jgi:DNA-binding CsgD family transcriptional regulator